MNGFKREGVMFRKLNINDYLQVIVIILVTVIGSYFYVNNQARNKLWLKTYPIRAQLAIKQLVCSSNSPDWMVAVLKQKTLNENAPANQIAYISPDGQLYHCENGYIGEYPVLSKPITDETRFRYASVTKLWTSDAILELIKQGRLSFDTKLASVLPEINQPLDSRINDITIGHLLLHRGGFDRYQAFGQDMFGIGEPICPYQLDKLNKIRLWFTPNEKMSYSNLGYCLLGEVISSLYDEAYTHVMRSQYHFDTTKLAFIGNNKLPDEVNYNYVEIDITGAGDIFTAFNYEGLASAAGLSGNAIDLVKQVELMLEKPEPNILSRNKQYPCDISKLRDCYGYAMFPYQEKDSQLTVYFRDGSLLGLASLVVVDSEGGVTALLSNGVPKGVGIDNIKMQIYHALQQQYVN